MIATTLPRMAAASSGSDRFAYLRVAETLRREIRAGEFPRGAGLPSVGDLAERFGVADTTVRKALSVLVDDGTVPAATAQALLAGGPGAAGGSGAAEGSGAGLAEARRISVLEAQVGELVESIRMLVRRVEVLESERR